MEELGIVPEEIFGRIKSVLLFRDINAQLVEGTDLGGPILIILALGVTLMCAGKLHFSYIYGIGMIVSLRGMFGLVLSVIIVPWCTLSASKFFESGVAMHDQRFLLAYPIGLIYAAFALITVF